MINKPIDSIAPADFHALVGHAYEQYDTEFKSALSIAKTSEKKEFLADVSSFANASGGDLIYGISEISGMATGVPGIAATDPDQLSLQVENLIRQGIDKRIEFDVRLYPLGATLFVLLIRVYAGAAKPHQVCYERTGKYYARGNTGKYQLDHDEIFRQTAETIRQNNQTSQFFADRWDVISKRAFSTPLHPHGLVALALVPSRAFDRPAEIDLSRTENTLLPPMGGGGHTPQYNGEGMLSASGPDPSRRNAYLQIYRNGILETVNSVAAWRFAQQNVLCVSGEYNYEGLLVDCCKRYLNHYEQLGVRFPVVAQVAVLNCSQYLLHWEGIRNPFQTNRPLGTDRLVSDDLMLYSAAMDIPALFKPFFDTVWNYGGWPRSFNFAENREWRPQLR